ncbi:MAG: cyclopropane-fatty-acyl-phospholipid synthase family protein [Vicinamibacterales bacterium]
MHSPVFLVAAVAAAAAAWAQAPSRPLDIHFTPTRQVVAEAMLDLAGTGADDVVYDLGSGDGRLVILAAQRHGARGVGYELQAPLVALSRQSAADAGVADRVRFVAGDLRTADLAPATVVLLYLSTSLTRELTPKLLSELRPGARIVSHRFLLADRPPDRSATVEGAPLHLWIVPPREAATAAAATARRHAPRAGRRPRGSGT